MIIDFASAKGGVGKSTLSTNSAYELSRTKRTLLIDMDIGSSVANMFFGKDKGYTIKDYFEGACSFEGLKQKIKWNLDLISSPNGFWQLTDSNLHTLINEITAQSPQYSYVIIDTAPGTSTINLELMKIVDKLVVIVNKEKTTITDNYIMIRDIKKNYKNDIHADIYFVANKVSDNKYAEIVFNNINTQLTKRELGNILMGAVISKSNNIEESVNSQKIFMNSFQHSGMANQIRTLINNIIKV